MIMSRSFLRATKGCFAVIHQSALSISQCATRLNHPSNDTKACSFGQRLVSQMFKVKEHMRSFQSFQSFVDTSNLYFEDPWSRD